MAEIRITAAKLPAALRREAKRMPQIVARATMRAAARGKAHLMRKTDEKGLTYQGQYKNSFHVRREGKDGAVIDNDAPHAGIIELGARPHPVSEEGIAHIREWVRIKLGLGTPAPTAGPLTRTQDSEWRLDNEEAERIVQGIVWKLRMKGQEPKYIFRDEQAALAEILREEVERLMNEPPKAPNGDAP